MPAPDELQNDLSSPDPAADAPDSDLGPAEKPGFPWMQDTLEWGVRARPGKHGLTLRDINIGVYGDVPQESREMTRKPRGAFPIPGLPRLDLYSINHKDELWS